MGCVICLRMSGPGKNLEGLSSPDFNIETMAILADVQHPQANYSDIIIIHSIALFKSERDGHSLTF
jgi:hypothetical protein